MIIPDYKWKYRSKHIMNYEFHLQHHFSNAHTKVE